VGIVAVSQMAAGDGIADIFGRRYGKTKWPFAPTKSLVGSTAFVVGGFVVSTALLALMNHTGVLAIDVVQKAPLLLGISLLSAAVELLPISEHFYLSCLLCGCLSVYLLISLSLYSFASLSPCLFTSLTLCLFTSLPLYLFPFLPFYLTQSTTTSAYPL
jgi:hypothetical protein